MKVFKKVDHHIDYYKSLVWSNVIPFFVRVIDVKSLVLCQKLMRQL